MKKTRFLWMLLLSCVLGFCVAGCTSRDEDDDDETYNTRDYIIGIGKWSTSKVKVNGQWYDDARAVAKDLFLEFFDKKADNGDRKFKSWEYHYKPGTEEVIEEEYEGSYVVNGKTVTCSINGQTYLRFVIMTMADNELGGTVTLYKDNMTFEILMKRTW